MALKPHPRRALRRLRFWLGALLAGVIIALAAAMALGQILLPLAARDPQRVAALLSRELGRPVSFARMQGVWRPGGPELTLTDLTLGARAGGRALHLAQARLRFSFGRLFWPDRHWIELSASGLDLAIRRDAGGRWHIAGFGGAGPGAGQGLYSLPVDLKLTGLDIEIQPGPAQPRYRLRADAVLISDRDDALRFGAYLRRAGMRRDLRVAGRFRADGSDGTLYLSLPRSDLGLLARDVLAGGYALTRGEGSVQAWLHWRDGRLQSLRAGVDLDDLALSGPDGRAAQLRRLAGTLAAWHEGAQWRLAWSQDPAARGEAPGRAWAVLARRPGGLWLRAQAQALELTPLAPLAGLLPQAPPALSRWLGMAALHGRIEHADLRWYGAGAYSFVAAVRRLGWAPSARLPGIDSLDFTALGDHGAIALQLPRQPLVFRDPHVFRTPLALDALSATLVARPVPRGWQVGIGALEFAAPHYAGSVGGSVLLLPGQPRPVLDLYAAVTRADLTAAKLFWPINILHPRVVEWLDRALVSGTVRDGRVVFRGDLRDWPFRDDQGEFQALARFDDASLAFNPHWPAATGVEGTALFENTGLTVRAHAGQMLGVPVHSAVARISDLGNAELVLAAAGEDAAAPLLAWVRQTPISDAFREAIRPLAVSGRAGWSFTLVLPVKDVHAFVLDGRGALHNVGVRAPDWKLEVSGIDGTLHFGRGGIRAAGLSARFRGTPGTLALAAGADTGQPQRLFQASLQGTFAAAPLLADVPALAPWVPRLSGRAPMTLGIEVDRGSGAQPATRTLSVQSDLAGMRVDLPAPLDKPAAQALPLTLHIGLPFAGGTLEGRLGGSGTPLLSVRGRLPDGPAGRALALGLGLSDAPPPPPAGAAGGLALAGSTPRLDVSGWATIGAGNNSTGARWPLSGSVETGEGLLFGRAFKNLHLTLASDAQGLEVAAAAPALAGTVRLPPDFRRAGISARLQRLYWPAEGGSTQSGTPAAPAPMTTVDPAALPPLHLTVDDFHLGAAQFGAAQFESVPIADGMRIERLSSHSPNVSMSAQGTWTGNAQRNHTRMVIDFRAADLGRMLEALGYQNLVAGGRTVAHIDASWPGAPSAFALDALDGTLSLDVSGGRILEVKPGAGRLLGLFSITELPRRLVFDFGDVFRKGFAFDSIKGHFTLGDGSAVTHDLEIRGPAADIKVDGRTGLRAHDYDQTVSVYPKVGSTLPVIGAVAGGPVGAAAGLALQGLLGSGLSQASGTTYKVTGSWDKPVVVKLDQDRARPARASSSRG